MPLQITTPDGRTLGAQDIMQLMLSPEFRFAGLDDTNWMHFAGDEIQRQQTIRDQEGSGRMNASEQLAIQDSFRMMAGQKPVAAGRDFYQEAVAASSEANPMLGFSRAALKSMHGVGTGLVGLVSPETASNLRWGSRGQYGTMDVDTGAAEAGRLVGGAWGSAPAVLMPGVGIAALGASAAGNVRTDIYESGKEVPWYQEAAAAIGTGLVEAGTEYIGAKVARYAGGLLRTAGPALSQAFKLGGRQGLMRALGVIGGKAFQFELSALGEGAEEAVANVLENAIRKYTWDPNQSITGGTGNAFYQGWAIQHLLAPLGAAATMGQGGGPAGQTTTTGEPLMQGMPGAGVDQNAVLQQFAQNPNIPDNVKLAVVEQIGRMQETGQNVLPSDLIADAMTRLGQTEWQQTPMGQFEQTQEQIRQETPLLAEAGEMTVTPEKQPSSLQGKEEGGLQMPAQAEGLPAFEDWVNQQGDVEMGMLEQDEALMHEYQKQYETLLKNAQAAPETTKVQKPTPTTAEVPKGQQAVPQAAEGVVGEAKKIIEQAAKPTELEQYKTEARTDALTKLGNRRAYDEASAALKTSVEETGKPGSVILFDVANLKAANEMKGHAGGDTLLKTVAEQLRKAAGRPADTITRQGGDEFAVFLKDTDKASAEAVRDRIEKAIGRTEIAKGVSNFISGEVATYTKGGNFEAAMNEADQKAEVRKQQMKRQLGEVTTREEAIAVTKKTKTGREEPKEALRAPRREGPRGSAKAEGVFNLAIQGNVSQMSMADRASLRQARTDAGQQELVNRAREGDLDAALTLTAANMGDIRQAARRIERTIKGRGGKMSMTVDELASEGAEAFLQAVRGEKSVSPTGRRTQLGDLARWDVGQGTVSTFLLGGRKFGPVGRRMFDLAIGSTAGVKARAAAPVAEEMGPVQEKQARQVDLAEDKPMSQDGIDIVEQAKAMLAEGKSETDVKKWVSEQASKATEAGIEFLPDAVDRISKGESFAQPMKAPNTKVRRAIEEIKKAGRKAELVEPSTKQEQLAQQFAASRGLDMVYAKGEGFRGAHITLDDGGSILVLRAGQGTNAIWEAVVHESWHGMGLDRLSVADENVLKAAEQRYLETNLTNEERAALKKDPVRLRREAVALVAGEVMSDPAARRQLSQTHPTLFTKIWNGLKDGIRRFAEWVAGTPMMKHDRQVVQNVVKLLQTSAGTTIDTAGIRLLPEPTGGKESGGEIESDLTKFYSDLQKIMAESPKQTGRPELANPMEGEGARRLMDYIDEQRVIAGKPQKRADAQVEREAKKLLSDKTQTQDLKKTMRAGEMLNDTQMVAAHEVLNEQAKKVFKDHTLSNVVEIQALGRGYREGRTGVARALRIGFDRSKTPSERVQEFVSGSISQIPTQLIEEIGKLESKRLSEKADKIAKDHAARTVEMLEAWKKSGIDLDTLTDEQARDPRIYNRIIKDIQRLNHKTGAWDSVHEYRRNALMYAPATWVRNALGGFYSISDVFITKPLARSISSLLGKSTTGETAAAVHAWGSDIAVSRALNNAAMTMIYELPQLETQISMRSGKSMKGVAETEIYSPTAISGEGVSKVVEAGLQALGTDHTNVLRAGKAVKAMGNVLGRVIRGPQVFNAAVDEFVKTLHIHSEVAAQAVRLGRASGLKVGTTEMQQFVNEQLTDMDSESWTAAIDSGESWRTAFQGESTQIEKTILDWTSPKKGFIGNFLRLLIPFRKTPIQLAGQALMHVPGVGATRMVQRAIQSRKGGKAYTMDEFSRHAAQQILGMVGTALIWNLVDDDDEKAFIKFTGAASYAREERQERITKQQIEPYLSFKVGGEWYSYNYIEPFSQWLGTATSFVSEMKRASRTGAKPSETATRLWRRLTGMYSDQTYIRTLGELSKIISDNETYTLRQTSVNFAASWLPNFVDTVLRDQDPYIREKKLMGVEGERPTFGTQVAREMFPTGSLLPPPKVDFFGNDITIPGQLNSPNTMFTVRLLSPVQPRYTVEGKQADVLKMLLRWNEDKAMDDPQAKWFQEPSRKVSIRYPNQPKPIIEDMNEEEYYLYAKLSGLIASEYIEDREWNVKNPTYADIQALETILSKSRESARKYIKAARQYKALDEMGRYREVMGDLRDEIKKRTRK